MKFVLSSRWSWRDKILGSFNGSKTPRIWFWVPEILLVFLSLLQMAPVALGILHRAFLSDNFIMSRREMSFPESFQKTGKLSSFSSLQSRGNHGGVGEGSIWDSYVKVSVNVEQTFIKCLLCANNPCAKCQRHRDV